MNEEKEFKYIMEHTKILRFPKHNLATFGVTNIYYYLLASSLPNKVKIREGRIISERPKILLPQQLDNIFEGFDKDAESYAGMLFREFGSDLRIFQYRFRNESNKYSVKSIPLEKTILNLNERIEKYNQEPATIIKGIEKMWQVCLMKFIIEMTVKSFYDNVTELQERGFLENRGGVNSFRHGQIEKLFREAQQDKTKIDELGKKLSQYGLFERYESRFFSLFKKRN